MSAVDQDYRYAINLRCDWAIVTSMCETRLYHKGSDQHTFEKFELGRWPRTRPHSANSCFFSVLSESSRRPGAATSSSCWPRPSAFARADQRVLSPRCRYYAGAGVRAALPRQSGCPPRCHPGRHAKAPGPGAVLAASPEARGLLPHDTVQHAYQHTDLYNPRPIYENFRGCSGWEHPGGRARAQV